MSEQVICLSDSEESTNGGSNSRHWEEEKDFSFPPVEFTYEVDIPVKLSENNAINDDLEELSDLVRTQPQNGTKNNQNKIQKAKTRILDSDKNPRDGRAAAKTLSTLEKRNLKNIQPGECMKSMTVCLDRNLEYFEFYGNLVQALGNSDCSWDLEDLAVPSSIQWTRKWEELYTDDSNEIRTRTRRDRENHLIVIRNCGDIVQRVAEQNFQEAIEKSLDLVSGAQPTLILYGVEEYFKNKKQERNSRLPRVSRMDLEACLVMLQLTTNWKIQLAESPDDLVSLVQRFTKSIAENQFKIQKRLQELDWYASGDNKDTVKVDKSGCGLMRLWLQQLCQFNLANEDIAVAVSSVYPSPVRLMEAYRNCTREEGEKLLKDIPIRETRLPWSETVIPRGKIPNPVRKIGPEMSKKIFVMFTSRHGEAALGCTEDAKQI